MNAHVYAHTHTHSLTNAHVHTCTQQAGGQLRGQIGLCASWRERFDFFPPIFFPNFFACVCACFGVRTHCMHVCSRVCLCVCARARSCVYARTYVRTYVRVFVRVYTYKCESHSYIIHGLHTCMHAYTHQTHQAVSSKERTKAHLRAESTAPRKQARSSINGRSYIWQLCVAAMYSCYT